MRSNGAPTVLAIEKRNIRNYMVKTTKLSLVEVIFDFSFQRDAILFQSDLLQFFSWLNCWEKKGHGTRI